MLFKNITFTVILETLQVKFLKRLCLAPNDFTNVQTDMNAPGLFNNLDTGARESLISEGFAHNYMTRW